MYQAADKFFKKKKYYTKDEVNYKNAGMFTPNEEGILRDRVEDALSKVPINIVNKIMKKCIILSGLSEGGGEYLPAKLVKKLLRGKGLIIVREDSANHEYMILHECAHCYLDHTHGFIAENWTEEVRLKQEKEADDLVKKWLKDHKEADPTSKLSEEELVKLWWKQKGIDIEGLRARPPSTD